MSSRAALALAKAFEEHPLGAATSAHALAPSILCALGEAARSVAYAPCERADHGSYLASERTLEPALEAELRASVRVIGAAGALAATRWTRLRQGDYSLPADDAHWLSARTASQALEVTVDLSTEETGEGDCVYTHRGAVFFTVPQRLGQIAIVRRAPSIARYDRYLTHRVGEREVHRVRLLFASRSA